MSNENQETKVHEGNQLKSENNVDRHGNPTGGWVRGNGLKVRWQEGPLGRPPKTPNGAFVDDLLEAALQRLHFYQEASNGKFACRENAIAITKIEEALHWLLARRVSREKKGVQGTHNP